MAKLFFLWLFLGFPVFADTIAGQWLPPGGDVILEVLVDETARIRIKRTLDPQFDVHNPYRSLRGKLVDGLEIGKDFTMDGGNWSGGTLYDPQNGKTYRGTLKLLDDDHLSLRGYIGLTMFGRSEVWTRRALFESKMATMLSSECAP